jgi:hypothetical protein
MRWMTGSTIACLALVFWVAPASAAPTKSQFIRQGDALCLQAKRQLVPLQQKAQAAKSLPRAQMWSAVTRLWSAQLVIQQRFVTRFRAIGTPAHDASAQSLVADLVRGVALAKRVRDAFAARNTVALNTALPGYISHTLQLNRRVVRYGFRICGR